MTYHYNCQLTKQGVNELQLQLLHDKMAHHITPIAMS